MFFLRPVPQKPEYSCLGVCKGGKMSNHSVVNGGSASLYVPEIQNSKVVFNTKIEGEGENGPDYTRHFPFQKIKSPGLMKMQVAHEALWLAGYFFCLPWESRVFPSLVLRLRTSRQGKPQPVTCDFVL